jgi:hypothetical protein
MSSDSRIYFMLMTAVSCAFTAIGFHTEGYISNFALIAGGLYFGHLFTEALNYDETAKEGN